VLLPTETETRLSENQTITEGWEAGYARLSDGKRRRLPAKLSGLRQKLSQKAKQEPKFRLYTLYDRIDRRDVLEAAWYLARANGGAPGIDGVTFEAVEQSAGGAEAFLDEVQDSLRSKRYRPDAVLRVCIPKPDGRKRPLGIPTMVDRVVQTACLLILEPIFEADFLEVSYGFRPGRSPHQALDAIRGHLHQGFTEVYDADLQGYFDSIPHEKLLACLRMRISDRSVLKLIRMWLKAPVIAREAGEGGGVRKTTPKRGTPQGGVISPLLANSYLHWFDTVFHRADGPAQWANARLVRFADDFVILARYQGYRLQEWVRQTIEEWLGLSLHRDKTQIVNLWSVGASFDFLGCTFRYDRDLYGRNRRYLKVFPSRKSVGRERDTLREMTHQRFCFKPIPALIGDLNTHLVGWANYCRYGYPRGAFRAMNWYVRERLYKHLRRRSQRRYRPPKGVSWYQHVNDLGLIVL